MHEIKNEEQLLDFVQKQLQDLALLRKERQKFLRENLAEDEIKEYSIILEDIEWGYLR